MAVIDTDGEVACFCSAFGTASEPIRTRSRQSVDKEHSPTLPSAPTHIELQLGPCRPVPCAHAAGGPQPMQPLPGQVLHCLIWCSSGDLEARLTGDLRARPPEVETDDRPASRHGLQ